MHHLYVNSNPCKRRHREQFRYCNSILDILDTLFMPLDNRAPRGFGDLGRKAIYFQGAIEPG